MQEKNSIVGDFVEADDVQKASSSFELKKTTKGINISVKIYACDTKSDIEKAKDECVRHFNMLNDVYGCKDE